MNNLSISLAKRRARQTEWRVFAILGVTALLFGTFIFLYLSLSQSLRTVRSVSDRSVETIAMKNMRRFKILSSERALPLSGMPFTLAELTDTKAKSIAFHFKSEQFIGFSMDHAPDAFRARARATGLLVQEGRGITTISLVPVTQSTETFFPLLFRTLVSDGLYLQNGTLFRTSLRKDSFTIHRGSDPFTRNSVHLPVESVVTSVVNTEQSELLHSMGPYRLIQGTVSDKPFFHLTAQSVLDTASLISIGTELAQRNNLSTQALTTTDFYSRTAVIGNNLSPEPIISSDGDITMITFNNEKESLYIVKTKEITTITTIKPTAELTATNIRSSCLKNAHSFVLEPFVLHNQRVAEVAESKGRLRICF